MKTSEETRLPSLMEVRDRLRMVKERQIPGYTLDSLAKLCGTDQSTLSRIMTGRNQNPSYIIVKCVIEKVDAKRSTHTSQPDITAKDIMSESELIFASPSDHISTAVKKMLDDDLSQLPVIEDNKVVGSITDKILLRALNNIDSEYVRDIMGKPFEVISLDEPIESIRNHLLIEDRYPAVLVSINNAGRTYGIITKFDLLKADYKMKRKPQQMYESST